MLQLLARYRTIAEQSRATLVVLLRLSQLNHVIANFSSQSIGLCKERTNRPYRAGKICLSIGHCHFCVSRVQFQQRLTSGDRLRVIDVQLNHFARHLGRDLHDVAVHVTVIRALEVARVPVPVAGVSHCANTNYARKDLEVAAPSG